MKKFIVLFREPDGRETPHSDEERKTHQIKWQNWFSEWGQKGKLNGGSGLTLDGRIIKENGKSIENKISRNGSEIIGGFLLITADNFEEATEMMKTCPIYEFGGYAEIRELQNQA